MKDKMIQKMMKKSLSSMKQNLFQTKIIPITKIKIENQTNNKQKSKRD